MSVIVSEEDTLKVFDIILTIRKHHDHNNGKKLHKEIDNEHLDYV